MTLQRTSSLHWNHLTLILKLCRLHTSYEILHLPEHPWQHFHVRGCMRTRLVKSALLSLISRPCCFKYIFSWLFVSASISVSFSKKYWAQERAFFLLFFLAFCIQELKVLYITFTPNLVHVVLGTELLQRPFFRGGNFLSLNKFFIWTLERSL